MGEEEVREMSVMSRNKEIIRMREAGETYRAIADKYGISIERARQIYCKYRNRKVLDSDLFFSELDNAAGKCGYDTRMAVRAFHCLTRHGVCSVEQLADIPDEELLGIRNFGARALEIVKAARRVDR